MTEFFNTRKYEAIEMQTLQQNGIKKKKKLAGELANVSIPLRLRAVKSKFNTK